MDQPRRLYQIQSRRRQLLPKHIRRGPRRLHGLKRRLLMAQHRQLPKLILPWVELHSRLNYHDDLRPQNQNHKVHQVEL